jgi:hypothetical protein
MTPEQHNILTQLAQLGLQKLTDDASAALLACAPVPPEAPPQDGPTELEGDAP